MTFNYDYKYERRGKHVFVPTDECVARGRTLIRFCESRIQFPPYFYHYAIGGHVAALHQHIENDFFFRIDLANFFYSISRNRVARELHECGFAQARPYAKWSCVKNPFGMPRYALPIGFVQSPILASMIILRSPLRRALELAHQNGVFVSLYFDDFVGSSRDENRLSVAYQAIISACREANFVVNTNKLIAPARRAVAFNCNVSSGAANVSDNRIAEFFDAPRTEPAVLAFEEYCRRVASQNHNAA